MTRDNISRLLIVLHAVLLLAINWEIKNYWGNLNFKIFAWYSFGLVFVAQAVLLATWAALSNQPLSLRLLGLTLLPILAILGSNMMLRDHGGQPTGWWSVPVWPNAVRQMAWTAQLAKPALIVFVALYCLRQAGWLLVLGESQAQVSFPNRMKVSGQSVILWLAALAMWLIFGMWLKAQHWSWRGLAAQLNEGMQLPPLEFAVIALASVSVLGLGKLWYRMIGMLALVVTVSLLDTFVFRRWQALWLFMDEPVPLWMMFNLHLAFAGVLWASLFVCRFAGYRLMRQRPA